MCLDVADGMLYLHTRFPPIIHRDIKSHNIFISELTPGTVVALHHHHCSKGICHYDSWVM